jgi:bifunctional UDP-N-acetylglucosamine pyrophosphorylase/glucosamine-1-phosphate N-acetyltransferase
MGFMSIAEFLLPGMQAVILAAGKGTRMGGLAHETPKPLLKIRGRAILEYTLANLPAEIDEVIFIIGHHGHKIRNHFGDEYQDKKLYYVWQLRMDGTAGAVFLARNLIRGRFMVLNGDDLYHHDDLKKIMKHKMAVLVKEVDDPGRFGIMEIDSNGHLVQIAEKPSQPLGNLVNAGVYVLDKRIFFAPMVKISEREYGLPQTLARMARDNNYQVKVERATFWHSNTCANDLAKAEEIIENFYNRKFI